MLPEEDNIYSKFKNGSTNSLPLKDKMHRYEADEIRKVLIKHNWNQSSAARELGISESNIRYKMQHLRIKPDD
jgi:transcriptional regulator with GAF, ATPase, and Fis domain